ncbi:hypothetical protein [Cytophaga hutchinsonii]|uniref:ApeA N-terminal domain-containing protein n=1 Tax=Cytophaga hutchinsonii (strain ATCC 33406 / DSM 1761 / CIP 103989 / NBRC 15051 / NCIMB 9469 / D465) TaxID=269798 RepID=A0A6N4SUW7_CYTH3|nr:hypothetical protein [Cytophaga hutchinsonii]ABG60185.1 hypothetical protein CHU_2943 [Cytophaga hutchinsonii ATCC 33406]SFX22437.1 hypothetical protein SAMN04487930_102118 [Cytophaga hutchinsonii ATCC 33406]
MSKTDKYLSDTLKLIEDIGKEQKFKVKVGKTKNHAFNNREFNFSKAKDSYFFNTTTLIRKGVQTDKEIEVKRETEVKLVNDERQLFTKGKYIIPSKISYLDFDDPDGLPIKHIEGSINSISTKNKSYYKKQRCYRIILPVNHEINLRGDFTGWHYTVDGKGTFGTLLKLTINNNKFHFFAHKTKDKEYYIIIDSISKLILDEFQKTANSILLAYAFLKGEYHGKEANILTYTSNNFKTPESILSVILGGGILDGFPVHTTKPHSLVSIKQKTKYKKDKNGKLIGVDEAHLKKYMVEFPHESLSKLCELICNKGGILRAVILFVSNHSATLELKVPTLFVALENVTKVLIGGDVSVPRLIEDDKIIKEIKAVINTAVKGIDIVEKDNKKSTFSIQELKDYKANFSRISSKLHDFNKGTNNKKLIEPFVNFGYTLSEEEKNLIFVHRNKFLHGDDYMSLEKDYEFEFKELFHISMRLQRMIAVLLLKASGYSGYILNNARIYDYISEKSINEDIFVKI